MPTYKFLQPDGTYQVKTVEQDLSNTAGYGKNILPVENTQTAPPANQRIKILNPQGLSGLTEDQIIREGQTMYLKPNVPIPKGQEQFFQLEPAPTDTNVNVDNVISQDKFNGFFNNKTISEQKNAINSALENYKALQETLANINFNPQEEYAKMVEQTGLLQKQQQLNDISNQIAAIQDKYAKLNMSEEGSTNLTSVIQGRLEQGRRAMNEELAPLLRQQAALANEIQGIQSNIQQQVSYGQAGFKNLLTKLGLKQDIYKDLKDELDRQQQLARQGKLDELDLALTLMKIPKGQSITLSDGTVLEGQGEIAPDLYQIKEVDGQGNVTVTYIDKSKVGTGENPIVDVVNLGQIGKGFKATGGGAGGAGLDNYDITTFVVKDPETGLWGVSDAVNVVNTKDRATVYQAAFKLAQQLNGSAPQTIVGTFDPKTGKQITAERASEIKKQASDKLSKLYNEKKDIQKKMKGLSVVSKDYTKLTNQLNSINQKISKLENEVFAGQEIKPASEADTFYSELFGE